ELMAMAIAKTAAFAVRPESLARCEEVIRDFVDDVTSEEAGTRVYVSLREQRDPTRFVHVMVLQDEGADAAHRHAGRPGPATSSACGPATCRATARAPAPR